MKTYMEAYLERMQRNSEELLQLAKDVKKEDPTIEIYISNNSTIIKSLKFFKGELVNNVSFHEVPYRWSGCGYSEHLESHNGNDNCSMPFTLEDVISTFKPITEILFKQPNEYFKSKEQFLKFYSFYKKLII